jgi:hypothetical protein
MLSRARHGITLCREQLERGDLLLAAGSVSQHLLAHVSVSSAATSPLSLT